VQGVSGQLASECMGCPLLLILAVSAIRQSLPSGADMTASQYLEYWNRVLGDFKGHTADVQERLAIRDYAYVVNHVYCSSISSAKASCAPRELGKPTRTVRGATVSAIDLLLQVFRLLPAGRWIPRAAVLCLWQALEHPTFDADTCNATTTTTTTTTTATTTALSAAAASLALLADYSIVMLRTASVYKRDGAQPARGSEFWPRILSAEIGIVMMLS
jgi:hypothetical protein